MSDATTLFNKVEQKCSNVNLIDETLCLSNSLNFIVSNMNNLSSSLEAVQNVANYLNEVYTLFTINSSSWIEGNNNITHFEESWNNCYTVVNQISSTWGNDFSLYYTSIIEINDWYNNKETYQNTILNWLTYNFPTNDLAPNLILSVYVNLYEVYSFPWTTVWSPSLSSNTPFSASYTHDCHLEKQSSTVICTKDCGSPYRGCNHHGGAAGGGPCDNAWDHCGKKTVSNGSSSYTCVPKSTTNMKLGPIKHCATDRFTAKIVRLTYQSLLNKWEFIS